MRFLMAVILLAFPILEIGILISLCQRYGWWVLLYLLIIGYLGLRLMRSEQDQMASRLVQQLRHQGNPVATLFQSARTMIAGILLLVPGVITDVIAVLLLLMPTASDATRSHQRGTPYGASANDDVIEGEFSKEPDATLRVDNNPDLVDNPAWVDNVGKIESIDSDDHAENRVLPFPKRPH